MYEKKENPLLTKSYRFSLQAVNFCIDFQKRYNEYVLSKQLLRSATAIGALSEVAQQAESKADFIHKLAIASKEAHETHYWLRLINDSKKFDENVDNLILDCEELMKLLVAIIKSLKEKR